MSDLILVRGLPGSGKSTLASKIAGSMFYNHLETDQFWMVNGEYKFDMSRIKEAHQWCQDRTREFLMKGNGVVVSNTFTTKHEMLAYFDMAKEFNIRPQVILCQGLWNNIHNVPKDVVEKMDYRFEHNISDLFLRLI